MSTEKAKKDYLEPTRSQLFWRTQRECWRRTLTPLLMYLFMSMILIAAQAITEGVSAIEIVLGIICIACGAAFNGHLLYLCGKQHYDAYLTGCIHRKNRAYGIVSGGEHHVEREYSPWKGFLIGFFIGVPTILMCIFAGFFYDYAAVFFIMLSGWAITPITWFGVAAEGGLNVSVFWSLLMVILPIVVSGVFYIVGAMVEKKKKEQEAARTETVTEMGKKGK